MTKLCKCMRKEVKKAHLHTSRIGISRAASMSQQRLWPTGDDETDKAIFKKSKLKPEASKRKQTLSGLLPRQKVEESYDEDSSFLSSSSKKNKQSYVSLLIIILYTMYVAVTVSQPATAT